jgi:hypothetical protein
VQQRLVPSRLSGPALTALVVVGQWVFSMLLAAGAAAEAAEAPGGAAAAPGAAPAARLGAAAVAVVAVLEWLQQLAQHPPAASFLLLQLSGLGLVLYLTAQHLRPVWAS